MIAEKPDLLSILLKPSGIYFFLAIKTKSIIAMSINAPAI